MNDDRFTNLERDIIRSVGRVLSSQELSDLKESIFQTVDQVEKVTQKTAQKIEETADKMGRTAQKRSTTYYSQSRTYQNSYGGRTYSNQQQYSPTYEKPLVPRSLRIHGSTSTALWLAFSILGIVFGACSSVISVVSKLILSGLHQGFSFALLCSLLFTGGSILSTVLAGKKLSCINRYRKYLSVIGNQPLYTVKELAEHSQINEKTVSSDLPKLLSAVDFPFAKLDDDKTCLILDSETYHHYLDLKEKRQRLEAEEQERKARLASDPNAAAVEEMKQSGMEALRKIRLANDALPEQHISEKLDSLEQICRKIFSYVEAHPEKLPQIRKLMSYYLPMTLKLVEAYQQLEGHQLNTTSIENSKEEILSALDKINLAFENLFDRLLENERMDLSADISVLETMLAQEGLTDHPHTINPQ